MKYLFFVVLFSTTIDAKESSISMEASRLLSSYHVIVDPMTDEELMTVTAAINTEQNSGWGNKNPIESLILTCSNTSQSIEVSYRDDRLQSRFNTVVLRIGKDNPIQLGVDQIYRPNKMFMVDHAKINLSSGVTSILSKIHKAQKVVVKLGALNQDGPQAILKITSKSSILKAHEKCSSMQ
jgi:hypothetical protein